MSGQETGVNESVIQDQKTAIAHECRNCGNINKSMVMTMWSNPGVKCHVCGAVKDWEVVARGDDVEWGDGWDEQFEGGL